MRELPLLMCPEMVKATYEGRKTNTRRIEKLKRLNVRSKQWTLIGHCEGSYKFLNRDGSTCVIKPRYQAGDILWIKEPHYLWGWWEKNGMTKTGRQKWRFVCRKSMGVSYPDDPPPIVSTKKYEKGWFKRTGRFMPKWCARRWLRVTAVKDPHQIQNISEEDAEKEGCVYFGGYPIDELCPRTTVGSKTTVEVFADLWNRLHPTLGERFEDHPWVFPYVFERIER